MIAGASLSLAWTDTSPNASGFVVERKTGDLGTWSVVGGAPVSRPFFTDPNLGDFEYFYRVRAANSAGLSDPSNEVSGSIMLPPAPFDLTAGNTFPDEIGLLWDYGGHSILGFEIERRIAPNGPPTTIATTVFPVQSYRDITLSPDTAYIYRVRAYAGNAVGGYAYSDYSPELEVATSPLPVPGASVVVTSALDSNARDAVVTLREAMLIAEGSLAVDALTPQEQADVNGVPAVPGLDEIDFAIPGPLPHSIALASPLPDVGDSLRIDGATQPGFAGTPIVELNGSGAGAGSTAYT